MTAFTFIHAADLHLDAPFSGLGARLAADRQTEASALAESIVHSGFLALERLTDACLALHADFLVLAGDVYNAAEGSLRARLALRDAFLRLEEHGIGVFLAHGNHDPYNENTASLPWPANVRVFGKEASAFPAFRAEDVRSGAKADPAALVYGISHAGPKESANLARRIARFAAGQERTGLFRIGLLHCAVNGLSGSHENYAPCSSEDLSAAGMDYWALGHVHGCRILDERGTAVPPGMPEHDVAVPLAAYPGSLQGLHVNESGPHGCLVVRVDASGKAVLSALPLAPVLWEQITLDTGAADDIPDLENSLLERLSAPAPGEENTDVPNAGPFFRSDTVLVRAVLRGRSALHGELRAAGAAEALREHLNAELSGSGVWLRDLVVATRPLLDMDAAREREDLAGEVLRQALALGGDAEALALAGKDVLEPLFGHRNAKKSLSAPEEEELAALVEEAALLCLDMLGLDDTAGNGEAD